jgi:hypothetical protein
MGKGCGVEVKIHASTASLYLVSTKNDPDVNRGVENSPLATRREEFARA